MNKDIRLNIALPDHPKINRLIKVCGEQAFRCLMRLWTWAADYEPQGHLTKYSPDEIEDFARWVGPKRKFYEALCNEQHQWIDLNPEDPDYKYLHDWHEHQPWVVGAKARIEKGKSGGRKRWGNNAYKEPLNRNQLIAKAREKGTHTEEEWGEMLHFFKACVMCGASENLVKGHLVPFAKGGSDSIKNIQPLCVKCSSFKGPDDEDYRIKHCEKHSLKMPVKWIEGVVPKEKKEEKRVPKEKPKKKEKDLTEALALANLMAKGILKHSPKYRTLIEEKRDKTINQWAIDIDLMIRRDKRKITGMRLVIDWIYNTSDFWYKNILSGYKFRQQYDRLVMEYKSHEEKTQKPRIQRIRQDPDAIKRQIRDMNNTINFSKATLEKLAGQDKLDAEEEIRNYEAQVEKLEDDYKRYA